MEHGSTRSSTPPTSRHSETSWIAGSKAIIPSSSSKMVAPDPVDGPREAVPRVRKPLWVLTLMECRTATRILASKAPTGSRVTRHANEARSL